MILLLGGTSETKPIAEALAAEGLRVLVSTATDIPLDTGSHRNIRKRSGYLNQDAMAGLIDEYGITIIVDATHPYASQVRLEAQRTSSIKGISYISFMRPPTASGNDGIIFAVDHDKASAMAFSRGERVFLTIGTRNLMSYVRESRARGIPLIVRVLPDTEAIRLCREAGIKEDCIIVRRGPFSVEENRRLIKKYSIGVLVTKDGGEAGGTPEKLEAARIENCRVIVVQRPGQSGETFFSTIPDLIAAVLTMARKIYECGTISNQGDEGDVL